MADQSAPNFVTQAEFARCRKVSRKAVTSWKQKGLLVLDEAGLVDVDQTEWNLDQRPAVYRGGVTHRPVRAKVTTSQVTTEKPGNKRAAPKIDPAPVAPTASSDEHEQLADLDAASSNLPMAEAVRRKENYLGLLRRHEFEVANKEWVRVEEVGRVVEQDYATVRERLLIIPGKVAVMLVGLDRAEIESVLRQEVTEALHELHDPDGIAQLLASGAPGADGQAGDEAPTDPQPH